MTGKMAKVDSIQWWQDLVTESKTVFANILKKKIITFGFSFYLLRCDSGCGEIFFPHMHLNIILKLHNKERKKERRRKNGKIHM